MLKLGIVAREGDIKEGFIQELEQKLEGRVIFERIPLVRDLIGEIKKNAPDMLLTVDLVGFERATLTDNIAYNLLDCKQVHLLLKDNLPNEKYLEKPLSIAMFFGCAGTEYAVELKNRYPHIPWLKELVGWNEGKTEATMQRNADILSDFLSEVMRECRCI